MPACSPTTQLASAKVVAIFFWHRVSLINSTLRRLVCNSWESSRYRESLVFRSRSMFDLLVIFLGRKNQGIYISTSFSRTVFCFAYFFDRNCCSRKIRENLQLFLRNIFDGYEFMISSNVAEYKIKFVMYINRYI